MIHSYTEISKATQWPNMYNETVRFLRRHRGEIRYKPDPETLGKRHFMYQLADYRIISFADAGFASLEGERSIEPNVVISGRILFRDGAIHCHWYFADHRCAKIQRVSRSSLSAECHAAVTAGDFSLWYQILLIEIFTRSYKIRRLCPPADCPMINPFNDSPSDALSKADKLYCNAAESEWNPASEQRRGNTQWNCSKCESCQISLPLSNETDLIEANRQAEEAVLFRPLLLTDCCSL